MGRITRTKGFSMWRKANRVTRKTCRKDYRITRENKKCKGDTDSKQIKKR